LTPAGYRGNVETPHRKLRRLDFLTEEKKVFGANWNKHSLKERTM
jgi:hypothetical protein